MFVNCKCKENITMRSTEVGFRLGDNLHVGDSMGPTVTVTKQLQLSQPVIPASISVLMNTVSACHSSFYQCVNEHCQSGIPR